MTDVTQTSVNKQCYWLALTFLRQMAHLDHMTGKCFASGIEEHREWNFHLRRVRSKCKYLNLRVITANISVVRKFWTLTVHTRSVSPTSKASSAVLICSIWAKNIPPRLPILLPVRRRAFKLLLFWTKKHTNECQYYTYLYRKLLT